MATVDTVPAEMLLAFGIIIVLLILFAIEQCCLTKSHNKHIILRIAIIVSLHVELIIIIVQYLANHTS